VLSVPVFSPERTDDAARLPVGPLSPTRAAFLASNVSVPDQADHSENDQRNPDD